MKPDRTNEAGFVADTNVERIIESAEESIHE